MHLLVLASRYTVGRKGLVQHQEPEDIRARNLLLVNTNSRTVVEEDRGLPSVNTYSRRVAGTIVVSRKG